MTTEKVMLIGAKVNKIVTKSNILIESKLKVTLQELRLIYWLLSNIQPDDEDFKTYRISVNQYSKFMSQFKDYKNKNVYSNLRVAAKKLMRQIITIKADGGEYDIPFISSAFYEDGKGYIDIKIHDVLKIHLLKLTKEFTSIGLISAFKLSSTYSIKLLEIVLQYKPIGKRKLDIADLKFILGVDNDKYKLWYDFEKRVLAPACKDINENTDISLSYEKIKHVRSIVAIEFRFSISKGKDNNLGLPNNTLTLSDMSSAIEEVSEISSLMKYGIKRNMAVKLFKQSPEKVHEALEAVELQINTIRNPSAWLLTFINEGWENPETTRQHVIKKVAIDSEEQKDIEVFKKWKTYVHEEVQKHIDSLGTSEKVVFKEEFLDSLPEKLKKHGTMSAILLKNWVSFFNDNGLNLLTQEEYKKKC